MRCQAPRAKTYIQASENYTPIFKTILLHFQPSSSPGDCTFEHDTCQWLFPGSVSEQTFFWNRTNADELKAQGLQGPGFDHVGNRKRK